MTRKIVSPPCRPSTDRGLVSQRSIKEDRAVCFIYRFFGILMVGHFVFSIYFCWQRQALHELFWLSHISTLIGGIGALTRRPLVISVALVSLFEHHLFWLMDTVWWLISGKFPLGITAYLRDASIGDWIKSANHFFSVPFLLVLAMIQARVHKTAWIWSMMLYAALAAVSAVWLPRSANVNCALGPCEGMDRLFSDGFGIHLYPSYWYLPFIIGFNGFLNYLPVNLVLSKLIPRIRIWAQHSAHRPE